MWRWQQSELNAVQKLHCKVFIASCLVHVLLLLLLFVVYRGYYAQLHLEITHRLQNSSKPVFFLPLHKKISGNKRPAHGKGSKGSSKKMSKSLPQAPKNTVVQPSIDSRSEKVIPAATTLKVDSITPPPLPKSSQVRKKQRLAKKTVHPTPKKEVERRKKEIAKNTPLSKALPVQEIPKKEEKKHLQKQPLKEEPVKKLLQQEVVSQDSNQSVDQQSSAQSLPDSIEEHTDFSHEDVEYIGQLERDALEVQSEIQQEIHRLWKPPVGLGPSCSCQIKVLVGWDGIVHMVTLEKKSGVLAYDMSVRNAVKGMHLPKAVWGKELIIQFNEQG